MHADEEKSEYITILTHNFLIALCSIHSYLHYTER